MNIRKTYRKQKYFDYFDKVNMSKMQPIPNKHGKFCGLCLPTESKPIKETS